MSFQRALAVHGLLFFALMLCNCGLNVPGTVASSQTALQPAPFRTMLSDFESGVGTWANNGGSNCPDANCFVQWVGTGSGQLEVGPVFEGSGALRYHLNNVGGNGYFEVADYFPDPIPRGATVNIALWLPKGSKGKLNAVQGFVKTGISNAFNKQYVGNYALVEDAWTVIGVLVPRNSATPVEAVGMAFDIIGTMNDDLYLDSVSFQ